MRMDALEAALAIAGLAVVSVATRGFFVLPRRSLPLPERLRQGLRYAPIGALLAVLLPELLTLDGQFIRTWQDPRLAGAAAALAWLHWRREMLGTIVTGTSVMLLCRLVLGW